MSDGYRTALTMNDWMRNQEKRIQQNNRRPVIKNASDLLGPGFAPTAVKLLDWNQDETAFTGFFYSEPGALNSPDSTQYWIGTVVSQGQSWGVQNVQQYRVLPAPATLPTWSREFYTTGTQTRTFTAWLNSTPGSAALNIRNVSGNYTATTADNTLLCSVALTIHLPVASSVKGREYTIKNLASSGFVAVFGGAGEQIERNTFINVSPNGVSITVQSDGSVWWIVAETLAAPE